MAQLRGKKPEEIVKRFKCLLFGESGIGKTTTAIHFPRPYVIDAEQGCQEKEYVDLLRESDARLLATSDFDEVYQEVLSLLGTRHDFKTLVIDPLTPLYNDLILKSIRKIARTERLEEDNASITAFGRHKQVPDRRIKELISLILRLDMNVIITTHAKAEWRSGEPTGKNIFDCFSKLDYMFDLVLEVQKRGKDRVCIVKKTRLAGFPDGEAIPFSYAEISKRYGKEWMEKNAESRELSTPEQVEEINRLLTVLNIPAEDAEKWMDRAGASSWGEAEKEKAEKMIGFLKGKIEKEAVK